MYITPTFSRKCNFPFYVNYSENETSDCNTSVTEILSPIAGGGGGREDGLQDDGKFGCVCGGEGGSVEMMGRGNNCGGGSGEGAEDQVRELRLRERRRWDRIFEGLWRFCGGSSPWRVSCLWRLDIEGCVTSLVR
jgi:hypothetical protein